MFKNMLFNIAWYSRHTIAYTSTLYVNQRTCTELHAKRISDIITLQLQNVFHVCITNTTM